MKKLSLLVAAAALAFTAGPALAKKQLVIVVKGLDNAFFESINQGCQKWNGENASSEYECFYTGPASTSDEAGEAQLDADLTKEDASLRKTYLGTDNYTMGFRLGEYFKQHKPDGGKVCTIQGNP